MEIELDEIGKKFAGLGLPGVILIIMAASAAGSNAVVAATLTGLGGPFGILGGIGILGLLGVLGDVLGGYGIEAVLKLVYKERSKNESLTSLIQEINNLPIKDELKTTLKNHVSPEIFRDPTEPRIVDIVE
ncbi:hypothetical protein [Floridanema evergladense]|uniref:Uncharacterized protein n=1 Tax=Floridaenema evergladense BLCC-F167 TaxID=3153639 RepID=A0ABV4WRR7_9CYAN